MAVNSDTLLFSSLEISQREGTFFFIPRVKMDKSHKKILISLSEGKEVIFLRAQAENKAEVELLAQIFTN